MLWQCKARILSHSSPHSSPWKSEPQKHRNDGGDIGGIVTTGNSENLFQHPGMMANISVGDFRETIEYNVQLKTEYLGQGGCIARKKVGSDSTDGKVVSTTYKGHHTPVTQRNKQPDFGDESSPKSAPPISRLQKCSDELELG
jgi:hypothetical protein